MNTRARIRLAYFNEIFGVSDFNRARENMSALRARIYRPNGTELTNLAEALKGTIAQLGPKKDGDGAAIEKETGWPFSKRRMQSLAAQSKKAKETYELASRSGGVG